MIRFPGLFVLLAALSLTASQASPQYPFAANPSPTNTIAGRIAAPAGYTRVPAADGTFAAWLRGLPLTPGKPDVRLFDGRLKGTQRVHHAVVDIDSGTRDLQQCADAVIRLRAEYLRAAGREDQIAFRFTSGDIARWTDWSRGMRPVVSGNRVTWRASAAADSSYRNFRNYLDTVFTYAGSHSLEQELAPVGDRAVEPGDVFIQGGFPGHAVIVVDVARTPDGAAVFLLAQSYMPAQDIHLLVNPGNADLSPWYRDVRRGNLETPEWAFLQGSLKRFR